MIQTGNARPMLGTLTPDRWGRGRYDRPDNAAWQRLQVKAARRAEAMLIAADLADEAIADLADREPATADFEDWDASSSDGDAHFDADDIQWGFRVTDAHKAPGVTSGRPRPVHLIDA